MSEEEYYQPPQEEKCDHPFIKGRKCIICGMVLVKALIEYRQYKPIEEALTTE